MRKKVLSVFLLTLFASTAFACNIPVFRYALERWRSDACEMIVFHDEPLTSEQLAQLSQLGYSADERNLRESLRFIFSDVGTDQDPERGGLLEKLRSLEEVQFPYLVARHQHRRGMINAWHGTLAEAGSSGVADSPVRQELARRLLAGHSVVWLVLRSADDERNQRLAQMLNESCETLPGKMELPDGIGLPGSELFSPVPLFLKFSVLEIDPTDSRESFLRNLFSAYQPEAYQDGQPLLIPVFGRGRALEVIPADQLSPALLTDLTEFLCGACSCQVKEQNPGFDLLLSVRWDHELFGEEGERPPASSAAGQGMQRQAAEPTLLTIPPGRGK